MKFGDGNQEINGIQIKNRIRDDSIQSEKGSTDHEKGLGNLVREIRKSMVY
jgi:hypothetical protein